MKGKNGMTHRSLKRHSLGVLKSNKESPAKKVWAEMVAPKRKRREVVTIGPEEGSLRRRGEVVNLFGWPPALSKN